MNIAINQILLKDSNINNVLDFKTFKNLKEISKSNTFFFSTISDCLYLQTMMFGTVSIFDISIDKYIAFLQDKFLNYDGYFKLACQLNESDINKFCRSNSSYKHWAGQIIKDKIDLNFVKQENQLDTLMYLAPVKYVSQEMRLWMIDGKCVEITPYATWENNYEVKYEFSKESYIKFAEKIAEDWEPDSMYVIDIGISYGKMYVIEYNAFSSSGFYDADVNKICKALKNFINNNEKN